MPQGGATHTMSPGGLPHTLGGVCTPQQLSRDREKNHKTRMELEKNPTKPNHPHPPHTLGSHRQQFAGG